MYTFLHWVTTPENRLAQAAVQRVATAVAERRRIPGLNPLVLHGPAGTGKTHLVSALVDEVTRHRPDVVVALLPAGDCGVTHDGTPPEWLDSAQQADLFVLEDVQHLPVATLDLMARILDKRRVNGQQSVVTASAGPALLTAFPHRFTGRLSQGLVVGLSPLSPASRRNLLEDRVRRRRLDVSAEVLTWLSEHVGASARQLDGALNRVETLTRLLGYPPDLATVTAQFQAEASAMRPSVERIVERVGCYFQVEPGQIRSRRRGRRALLPRQIGMYLARTLTPLSLQQIGAYFGGRDHTTVLHACRKVEEALSNDASLSGAVRQLRADLG